MIKVSDNTTLLTIQEASDLLEISPTAVYENIRKDNLAFIKGVTLESVEHFKVNRKRKKVKQKDI